MDDAYEKPVPLIASRHEMTSGGFFVCVGDVIIVALREFIENDFPDLNAHSKKQRMKDAKAKNAPGEEVKTELLNSISQTKVLFSEAIKSLDLFGNYIQRPGEKTAKRLKLSLEHRRVPYIERHSPDKINELVNIFRTCLNKNGYEYDIKNNYNEKSTNLANKNFDYDLGVESQPRSISPDGNKFDHASNHDRNENSSTNKNMNRNESNGEKESITGVQKNEQDELRFSPAELKQQPQKDEDSSLVINGGHREDVEKDREYSGEETLLLHERIMKQKMSKSKKELVESVVKKNLEDENTYLKEKLKFLQIRYKEHLANFGKCSVWEMDKEKEKEERKSEIFLQMNVSHQPEDKHESPRHMINENSSMEEEDSFLVINGKHGENVGKDREYSGKETLLMESVGKKNLEDENDYLKEKLKLLEIKYKELLADFGECSVREMAKEKEERKSELFLLMNVSCQPENKQSSPILSNKSLTNDPHGIIEDKELDYQAVSTSDDHPQMNKSHPYSIDSGKNLVQRTGQQLQKNGGEKQKVPGDKDGSESDQARSSGTGANLSCIEKKTPAVQSSSKKKTSSGEESKQSETTVSGISVMSSKGRDRNNDESLIEQSYETLPYSVQQDYSNAPEYITLKHIPPTSVAASLYNNYMFLLLCLAENLLSSDVVKLKVWAAQRFSIDNAQNATDVLLKLDQTGFIHASDLSQLRNFFDSILRIDLVCVIDAFLLGDYSVFREISASKKLDVNRSQTQQNTANSRHQNILSSVLNPSGSSFKSFTNASSISRRGGEKSLETSTGSRSKNESKYPVTHQAATPNSWDKNIPMLLARSPDENQTSKIGEQNLSAFGSGPPAGVIDTVVADTSVSS